MPHDGGIKRLRSQTFQDGLEDGASYRVDICVDLSPRKSDASDSELNVCCA